MGYTLAQVRGYLGAIGRHEQMQARQQLMLARAAQADGKGFDAVWKALG